MIERICPYANGINEIEEYGHCLITENSKCYDLQNYESCYFHRQQELKNET